jgi:hypothetical protein
MKTIIFYIFYSNKKKLYYSIKGYLVEIEKIHEIIKRRMNYSGRNIIDFDFDTKVQEVVLIKNYIKYGVLDFMGDRYNLLIQKIVDENNPSSYYSTDGENYSEYHLNLIEFDSFLSGLKKSYERKLTELRPEITITWLFG